MSSEEREEFEAILKEVNETKCWGLHEVEDECELFAKGKPRCVATAMDVDKHRWYEIATNVYAIGDWFIGVTGVNDLFSEAMGYEDCGVDVTACEFEAVQSITYKEKS